MADSDVDRYTDNFMFYIAEFRIYYATCSIRAVTEHFPNLRQDTETRYFESQKAKGIGNDSCTIVVCSMFNYCWWKGHFVGRTSESGISESDFLVLGCLTKSARNPLENFAVSAFPDRWLSSELKMVHGAEKKDVHLWLEDKWSKL